MTCLPIYELVRSPAINSVEMCPSGSVVTVNSGGFLMFLKTPIFKTGRQRILRVMQKHSVQNPCCAGFSYDQEADRTYQSKVYSNNPRYDI